MITWSEFVDEVPELARFGEARLTAAPAFLGTVRKDGSPRVHPVTPIAGNGGLYLFMEPTSPKRRDLIDRRSFALHNGVGDDAGTGGEFWLRGHGRLIEATGTWQSVAQSASYEPAPHYVLFELLVGEARAIGYGDIELPKPDRWTHRPV